MGPKVFSQQKGFRSHLSEWICDVWSTICPSSLSLSLVMAQQRNIFIIISYFLSLSLSPFLILTQTLSISFSFSIFWTNFMNEWVPAVRVCSRNNLLVSINCEDESWEREKKVYMFAILPTWDWVCVCVCKWYIVCWCQWKRERERKNWSVWIHNWDYFFQFKLKSL